MKGLRPLQTSPESTCLRISASAACAFDAGGFLCARPCKRNVYLLNGGKAGIIKQMGFCPRHAVHGERAEGGRTGRRVKSGLARGVRMVSPGDVYGSARVRENNPIASVSSPVCGEID